MLIEFFSIGLAVLFSPPESTAYTNVLLSDAELGTFGETLWNSDENNVNHFITINVQSSHIQGKDNAPQPLLKVQPQAYQIPTIAKLIALQDNYIAAVGSPEIVTPQESLEETEFLNAILNTTVIKKAEQFLRDKGFMGPKRSSPRLNPNANSKDIVDTIFRDTLREIWFGLYPRERSTLGSSGFEHSFVGEIKNGEISGFHNWVYYARQEANGLVNYNGHKRVIRLGQWGMALKFNFNWNSKTKPVTTMLIGTSPEFEMAIYTLCFFTRPNVRCPIILSGKSVPITTHYITKAGKRYVGSAYPEI